jgi:hypothetical protein
VPAADLEGMHIDLVIDIVNVDEHLGRLTDAGDGLEGVVFPQQREIGIVLTGYR